MNRTQRFLLTAMALMTAPGAWAQAQKVSPQMPGPAATKPFVFPKAATRTLANGVRVFVVSNSEQPAVVVRLVLTTAGTVNDPAGKPGVATLTADMLAQGTATRSAQQIAGTIDFVGGSLTASAGTDSTGITLTVVKKDLATGLELMADVLRNAAFSGEELDRRRQQLLSNLQVQYSDAGYLANAVFDRMLFGSHPYGLPGEGTPQSAKAITRDDLVRFRDTWYAPQNALLAFAGDITPEAAFAAAERYFGAWARSATAPATAAATAPHFPRGHRLTVVDKPDAVQTEIRVGRGGIARNSADYIPLMVTNRVFGGGFNSRLSTEVRQKKGLTYGAYSSVETNKLGGSVAAATFTRTEATVEATQLVVDLVKQMAGGEVTQEELDFARNYMTGVYPIQSETPSQVAGRILTVAEYGLAADYNDTYREKISAVGPAEVKAIGGKYFTTENLDIVVVGNAGAFRDALKKQFPAARFNEIPFDQIDLLAAGLRKPKDAAAGASPEAATQAREIVAAAIEAAGGAAAIQRVTGVAFSSAGKVNTPQGEFDITVKSHVVLPDKVWMEVGTPFGAQQQGFDGKSGWVASAQGAIDTPAAEAQRGVDLVGLWGVYRQAMAGKLEAGFAGEKEFQGRKTLAIDWAGPSGKVTIYFDAATRLPAGAAFVARTTQGEIDTVNAWSDYRAVDGVQFPYTWLTLRNGARFSDMKITDVKLNVPAEPGLFAKPK